MKEVRVEIPFRLQVAQADGGPTHHWLARLCRRIRLPLLDHPQASLVIAPTVCWPHMMRT